MRGTCSLTCRRHDCDSTVFRVNVFLQSFSYQDISGWLSNVQAIINNLLYGKKSLHCIEILDINQGKGQWTAINRNDMN